MATIGLSFVFAHGGTKYILIVKECILSAGAFCSVIALSHLDLLGHTTILKEGWQPPHGGISGVGHWPTIMHIENPTEAGLGVMSTLMSGL